MLIDRKRFVAALVGLSFATPALALELAMHDNPQAAAENVKERIAATAPDATGEPALTMNIGTAKFTLTGLIEVEASLTHPEGGDEVDDLRLSTVQIGLEAELTPWFGGHIIGLWEEDDTEPAEIDEAVLMLRTPAPLGGQILSLTVGRQYLPFGKFESLMISDPLTLDLGETRSTSGVFGVEGELWSVKVGTFEGSVDDGAADSLDTWVVALEVTPREGLSLGVSYLSDLAESGAGLVRDEALYKDEVPAVSVFLSCQHGDFGLAAEYLAASDAFDAGQVEAGKDLTGKRPAAWFVEASWAATDRLVLAARYERANDYQADARRYGAMASYGLFDFAALAVEYLRGNTDGDDPAHTFTAQLAVEF